MSSALWGVPDECPYSERAGGGAERRLVRLRSRPVDHDQTGSGTQLFALQRLGGALAVALLTYQSVPRLLKRALLNGSFAQRPTAALKNTLIGSALFGVGWGICGVCPGPAIAGLGAGNWPLAITVVAMLLGAYVQGRFARVN